MIRRVIRGRRVIRQQVVIFLGVDDADNTDFFFYVIIAQPEFIIHHCAA